MASMAPLARRVLIVPSSSSITLKFTSDTDANVLLDRAKHIREVLPQTDNVLLTHHARQFFNDWMHLHKPVSLPALRLSMQSHEAFLSS